MKYSACFLAFALLLAGCATMAKMEQPAAEAAFAEGAEAAGLTVSLFPEDSEKLSNQAVQEILSAEIKIREGSLLAVLKLPNELVGRQYYGYYYWRDEEYLDLQEAYMSALIGTIAGSARLRDIVVMPSMVRPKKVTLPNLRESAVRMKSDLLLVYLLSSDSYHRFRFFAKDKVKAFTTCEAMILDNRTGIIVFSTTITRKYETMKSADDYNLSETTKRALAESILLAVKELGEQVRSFLDEG